MSAPRPGLGATTGRSLRLRRATLTDVAILEHWDIDPDVIAATTADVVVECAFGGLNWREELLHDYEVSYPR